MMTRRPSLSQVFVAFIVVFFLILSAGPFPTGSISTIPAAAGIIEIAELLAHPEQYDHQDVMVTGKVMNVQLATNRQGQPAY